MFLFRSRLRYLLKIAFWKLTNLRLRKLRITSNLGFSLAPRGEPTKEAVELLPRPLSCEILVNINPEDLLKIPLQEVSVLIEKLAYALDFPGTSRMSEFQ